MRSRNGLGTFRKTVGEHGDGDVAAGAIRGGGSDEREDDHADECGGLGPGQAGVKPFAGDDRMGMTTVMTVRDRPAIQMQSQ